MPTPFLALNWKDESTPQPQRYLTGAGGPVSGSATFGTLETGTVSGVPTSDRAGRRIMRFGGHSTFICAMETKIWRSTDGGASWTDVHTDSDLGTTGSKSGPYLLYPGGVPTLVILARSSGSTHYLFTSADGVTWVKSSSQSLNDSGGCAYDEACAWRGTLYVNVYNGSTDGQFTIAFNTVSAAVIAAAWAVGRGAHSQPVLFNDRLFCVGVSSASGTHRTLWELVGGAWTAVDNQFLTGAASPSNGAKWTAFVDGASNKLIAIVEGVTGAAGWRVYSWDSSLTRTEITADVGIQAAMGTTAGGTSRVSSLVDGGDPGLGSTNPGVFLFQSPNGTAGTSMNLFQWNGIASSITNIGSGGNVQHALPLGDQVRGEAFWTSGQRHAEITGLESETGGVRVKYKLYSPNSGPDLVSLCFFTGDDAREYSTTPKATLQDPSDGDLVGSDTVDNLDAADEGATEFDVRWAAEDDGYSPGDRARLMPQITTS